MYQRLTTTDVAAIERCLAAGMRHIEIARRLNLSVWPIARIADRRRFERDEAASTSDRPHSSRHAPRDVPGTTTLAEDLIEDDGPPDYQAQNLHRCPGCGAMIYVTPCIACQMATLTQPVPPPPPIDDEPNDDELRLTTKQLRWRRKRVRELVFGEE